MSRNCVQKIYTCVSCIFFFFSFFFSPCNIYTILAMSVSFVIIFLYFADGDRDLFLLQVRVYDQQL